MTNAPMPPPIRTTARIAAMAIIITGDFFCSVAVKPGDEV
jgi:hypothetical protein